MKLTHYIKHPGAILLLPNRLRIRIKSRLEITAFKWALKSPRRASYYYCFFSTKFDREHYSVLVGKNLHIKGDISSLGNNAFLRRSFHMIEKGLVTLPLKDVWAEGYIENTIEALKTSLATECDKTTHQWAFNVLDRYFNTIKPTDITNKAKSEFDKLVTRFPLISCEEKHHSPYLRKEIIPSGVSYDTFIKLCKQRHSVRWYEDKNVPIDLVKKAITAGLTAPSACNRQPFRYIIVHDHEKLKKTVNLPMGCNTFAHNIKLMVILIGDLSAYFDERDRHLIYIDGGLSAMNFMMALETLGLSSCPINWPDIEKREEKITNEFKLMPHEKGIMFFSIGYPLRNGGIPFSAKKNVERVTTIY
jgi:nitroreductase